MGTCFPFFFNIVFTSNHFGHASGIQVIQCIIQIGSILRLENKTFVKFVTLFYSGRSKFRILDIFLYLILRVLLYCF